MPSTVASRCERAAYHREESARPVRLFNHPEDDAAARRVK
jgi:hypothetical protein